MIDFFFFFKFRIWDLKLYMIRFKILGFKFIYVFKLNLGF